MIVPVLLVVLGLGVAVPTFTSAPASGASAASSVSAGMDQPTPKQKRFGGSASCTIECTGPNGTVCRQIIASCGLTFDTELAAKSHLEGKLNAQAGLQGGRISSGVSFSISWRWSN